MEDRETIIRLARSEMAREAVEKRWASLSPEERKEAVAPANEGRRRQAARKREARAAAMERWAAIRQLDLAMGRGA